MTFCCVVWFHVLQVSDRKKIERVTKNAAKIIGCELNAVQDILEDTMCVKFEYIKDDITHPLNSSIVANQSGRVRQIATKTNRFRNSFLPCAIRSFNSSFQRQPRIFLTFIFNWFIQVLIWWGLYSRLISRGYALF